MLPHSTLMTGTYRSYLVRFWQGQEQGQWYAATQCIQTGKTIRFGNLEGLLAFLQRELDGTTTAPDRTHNTTQPTSDSSTLCNV